MSGPGPAKACLERGNPTPPATALTATPESFMRFCEFLERTCGIKLGEDKGYLVSSRLGAIQREHACHDLGELVARMTGGARAARELRTRVVDAMTTNETLWFRDDVPFTVLKETVLPELAARGQRIRVWSAACSTGQEPYSVSMCVEELRRERPGMLRAEVEVTGTDISGSALQTARNALYAEHTLRRGLSDQRRRWFFETLPGGCRPRDEVRARVTFRELNLLDSFALLGRFDVIFCRNVLIYFSSERRLDILCRIAAALNPGGWLFLGGTESLPGAVKGMTLQRQARSVVYRKD